MADTNNYDLPNNNEPVVSLDRSATISWYQWAARTHRAVFSTQQSGPSAERPANLLWIGRRFFDTTLGKPVYVKQVKPTIVWVDGVGTIS